MGGIPSPCAMTRRGSTRASPRRASGWRRTPQEPAPPRPRPTRARSSSTSSRPPIQTTDVRALTKALPLRVAARVLLPFACGYLLSYLLRAVNAVVAPDLVAAFSLSPADLGLLTAAYLGAFCLFQLPLGVLLDRYGPRRVQSIMLIIAASGCALFALANGFLMLFAARAMIGLGFAGGLMASFKASSMWVPLPRRSLSNTLIMGFGGLGIVAATAPTAFIVDRVGWRATFLIFA